MIDYTELKKLSRSSAAGLKKIRLAILGDCSTQHITTAVKGFAITRGISADVFEADYNQIDAQIIDAGSELYRHSPEFVLFVMCTEKLRESFYLRDKDSRTGFAADMTLKITRYWDSVSAGMPASVLQFSFPYINDGVFGSFGLKEKSSFVYQLQLLNSMISQEASKRKNVFIIDINAVQSRLGEDIFFDSKLYYIAKMPFSLEALPYIALRTVSVIAAVGGNIKKCVILDLDNTLWGGVIGDDGLEGIRIGELGTGRAFSDFQSWLRGLRERGILLAVCSKNNPETARLPFEKHPDMILRLDDFAMFVANWEDKASNIVNIQQTLNIGMDSIVFIDDNPFERDQVRSAVRDITVPEMPEDPSYYVSFLKDLCLFETASFSETDAGRTEMYRQEAQRTSLMASYGSYDDYLMALEMRAVSAEFDSFHYPRIAQLTQRSNQFNLRTVRYTEAQIEALAHSDAHITRYYCLRDRLGDHGLIAVVVLDRMPDGALFISELLMSCRVLKRGMEEFIINDIVSIARKEGFETVVGEYIPTPKNSMVADLYTRLGFTEADGKFYANVSEFKNNKTFIQEELLS
jgi:FkbH-like protein